MNSNVDTAELATFEAMAQNWWDPKGSCRPLHALNPTRLQFIVDRCPLVHKTVIDIGCGGGILSESMAARGAQVIGIDATPAVLEIAKAHAHKNNISNLEYIHSTAEAYAERYPAHFDAVTCLELLEHVPNPLSLIQAAARLVKPGGDLFFSTLNRTPKSYLFAIVGAEYLLKLLPKGTHHPAKFIRPAELEAYFRQATLELKEFAGLAYNPLTQTVRLTQDVSVNYLAHAQKPKAR